MAILFHALYVVAAMIVDSGGTDFMGCANINPFTALINLTACFETQALLQLARISILAAHARWVVRVCRRESPRDTRAVADDTAHSTLHTAQDCNAEAGAHRWSDHLTLLKQMVWAVGWAGVIIAVAFSNSILGMDLFASPIWFIVVGTRLGFILVSEGVFSTCGCTRDTRLRRFFTDLEGYNVATPPHVVRGVLGWTYMQQPFGRVWRYSRESAPSSNVQTPIWACARPPDFASHHATFAVFWLPLILGKILLDLQILTQQINLMKTVQDASLSYQVRGDT